MKEKKRLTHHLPGPIANEIMYKRKKKLMTHHLPGPIANEIMYKG